MKHKNIRELMTELQDTEVQLPLHKQALREQLFRRHPSRASQQRPRTRAMTLLECGRTLLGSRKLQSAGVALVLVIVVLLGLWMLLPASGSPTRKFIAQATQKEPAEKTEQVNPPKSTPTGQECLAACSSNTQEQNQNAPPAKVASAATVSPAANPPEQSKADEGAKALETPVVDANPVPTAGQAILVILLDPLPPAVEGDDAPDKEPKDPKDKTPKKDKQSKEDKGPKHKAKGQD